jgi:hypothetical protein
MPLLQGETGSLIKNYSGSFKLIENATGPTRERNYFKNTIDRKRSEYLAIRQQNTASLELEQA